MADDKQKRVAVEDMIPHPPSDYVDWMDRLPPSYEGKPPIYRADAAKTEREKDQETKEQEAKKGKPAAPDNKPTA